MHTIFMLGLHNPTLSEVAMPRASAPILGFSQSLKLLRMQDFMQCFSGAGLSSRCLAKAPYFLHKILHIFRTYFSYFKDILTRKWTRAPLLASLFISPSCFLAHPSFFNGREGCYRLFSYDLAPIKSCSSSILIS